MTAVMSGRRIVHAMASCPSGRPYRAAMGRSLSTKARLAVRFGSLNGRVRLRQSHADIVCGTVIQQFPFDVPHKHTVDRLQRRYRMDSLHALELIQREVGHASIANLALLDETGNRAPPFFDLPIRSRAVDLIEINDIHIEAAQAEFHLFADALCFERRIAAVVGALPPTTLGRHDDALGAFGEGTSDKFLTVPVTIQRRDVDPVDAEIKGSMDSGNGFSVIAIGVAIGTPATDRRRAKADRGQT